ncbi:hypothetical protein BJ165DRAFT_1535696, partial [Panaeolus papilionaceus]
MQHTENLTTTKSRKRSWRAMNEGSVDIQDPIEQGNISQNRDCEGMSERVENTSDLEDEEDENMTQHGKEDGTRTSSTRQGHDRRRERRTANVFIDDEANVGETSDEDDEDEDMLSFLQDDSIQIEQGTSRGTTLDRDDQHNQDRERYWREFLDRACNRANNEGSRSFLEDEDNEEYTISPRDLLWVVPCHGGHEEEAVFTILDRATHPTMPNRAGLSAMFNATHPGRIYIEASTEILARATIEGIPGLITPLLKPVPQDQRRLCVTSTPRKMPLWVRIRDRREKWNTVNGTIGLIVPVLNGGGVAKSWSVVVAYKDPMDAQTSWSWKSAKLDDINFTTDMGALPTTQEIQRFA